MTNDVRWLLAVSAIRGEVGSLERLLDELPDLGAEAIVVVGDLGLPWSKAETYRAIFKALGNAERPAFWVPGPTDAPLRDYLRASANMEIVYPFLRGVHGTLALAPGSRTVFAGMGGEIVDDPDAMRAEEALVRYPGWEVEYRLKAVREFEELEKVFLFTTPPAHKGSGEPGSEALAQLIKTYNPRLAIVGGEHPLEEWLGDTLVLCPGPFDQGRYALVHLDTLIVEPASITDQAPV